MVFLGLEIEIGCRNDQGRQANIKFRKKVQSRCMELKLFMQKIS